MRHTRLILLIATLLIRVSFLGQGTGQRPLSFEDMMSLKRISGPQISPDGKWVLFSAVDVNLAENTKTPHLWLVPLSGSESRQLTFEKAGEDRGRWSPDGRKILFVSSRDGSSQVWVSGFDSDSGKLSGDPQKITSISTEADGAMWSPDGKNILFTSTVYPDCPDDACNQRRDRQQAASKVKAMVFTRLLYRHWSSFTRFKRSHLFVVPASGGVAKDITPGDHDVPPFSLGGQDLYALSPDGQEVAFTSNIDEVEATSTNNDIFVIPIAGGTPKKLSTSPGSDSTPLYSPDGHYLAWRMQKRPGYESDRFRLVIYDRKTGQIRNLTEDFDRWVDGMVWSPDSRQIYFTSGDKGEEPIYRIDVEPAGAAPQEITRGANDDLVVSPDGKTLVFTRMSIQAPNEIYKLALGSKQAEALSRLNDPLLSQIAMQPVEPFWFIGGGGAKVEGFLLKPPGFDVNKKYPMKFLIHGGPQGRMG